MARYADQEVAPSTASMPEPLAQHFKRACTILHGASARVLRWFIAPCPGPRWLSYRFPRLRLVTKRLPPLPSRELLDVPLDVSRYVISLGAPADGDVLGLTCSCMQKVCATGSHRPPAGTEAAAKTAHHRLQIARPSAAGRSIEQRANSSWRIKYPRCTQRHRAVNLTVRKHDRWGFGWVGGSGTVSVGRIAPTR